MSNYGAADWTPGGSIYMLETIFQDGTSKYKLFPNIKGFRQSLRAVEDDIRRYKGWRQPHMVVPNWNPIACKKYIMNKTSFEEM